MPAFDALKKASRAASPPRVAYVVKRFPRLSETFVLNECLELERQGFEVEIFSLLSPPPEPRHALLADLKAPVTYLDALPETSATTHDVDADYEDMFAGKQPAARARLISKAHHVAEVAAASGCSHFHAHFGSDATTVAALAAREMGVGYSFTAHAKDIYPTYVDAPTHAAMRRAKIRHAAFVATVSDYNKAHLLRISAPGDRAKIHRIYNGIDLSRFEFVGPERREKARILAVGRLVEKKGYADLIAAVGLLRDAGVDVSCVICGDGGLRTDIERQIAEADLGARVTLLGAVDQSVIIREMRRATALVLPAVVTASGDRDALPTVLLEAQAMGLPVVSTPVCGIPEIIAHEETGLLAPERYPERVAEAIRLLVGDQALCARLAANARLNAERLFDLKASVGMLKSHFQRAIRLGTSRSPSQSEISWAGTSSAEVLAALHGG